MNKHLFLFVIFISFFITSCNMNDSKNEYITTATEQNTTTETKETIETITEEIITINYEDAVKNLFNKFDLNGEDAVKMFKEYEIEYIDENGKINALNNKDRLKKVSYSFIDSDNDGEYEVILFFNERYIKDKSKGSIMLFDYDKEKGFTQMFTQIYPYDFTNYLKTDSMDSITDITINGFIDNKTQEKIYLLITNTKTKELSTFNYSLRADIITNKGLENLLVRNDYSYYSQNNNYEFMGIKNLDKNSYLKNINEYFNDKTEFSVECVYFDEDEILNIKQLEESALDIYRRAMTLTKTDYLEINSYTWYANEEEFLNSTGKDVWDKKGNTNSNLCNGGLVAGNSMWTFYCSNDGIYRHDINSNIEDEDIKILNVKEPKYLNISNGWLYYISDSVIYRSKFDGQENKQISLNGITCTQFQIYEDIIYINSSQGIKTMNLDGSNLKDISSIPAYSLNIIDDTIYFINTSKLELGNDDYWPEGILYRVKTDGTNLQKVTDKYIANLIHSGDYLYYSSGFYIYRYNLNDGSGDTVVSSYYGAVLSMNVTKNNIYYKSTQLKDAYTEYTPLIKANNDGSDKKVINELGADYIYINEYDKNLIYILKDNGLYKMLNSGSEPRYLCDVNKFNLKN